MARIIRVGSLQPRYADLMSEHTPEPFSIRLFLAEGSALGVTIATIGDWTGSLIRCGSASLPALQAGPEAQRSGVYVIQGPAPDEPNDQSGTPLAYIGQGGKVGERLSKSLQKQPLWETAVVLKPHDQRQSDQCVSHGGGVLNVVRARGLEPGSGADRIDEFSRISPRQHRTSWSTPLPLG
jgi:hypothetical protein